MTQNELDNWNGFRAGDKDAFARVYDTYADMLFRYGMKIVPNKDIVFDAIHDIFIKLYRLRLTISETDNPRLYLFKSFRGQLYDNLKKEQHLPGMSLDEIPFNVEYIISEELSLDRQQEEEYKEMFRHATSHLTDRQQEAIYLHYTMGLDFEEVSSLMEMKVQSTRNLMFRAISKIRKIMPFWIFLTFFQ